MPAGRSARGVNEGRKLHATYSPIANGNWIRSQTEATRKRENRSQTALNDRKRFANRTLRPRALHVPSKTEATKSRSSLQNPAPGESCGKIQVLKEIARTTLRIGPPGRSLSEARSEARDPARAAPCEKSFGSPPGLERPPAAMVGAPPREGKIGVCLATRSIRACHFSQAPHAASATNASVPHWS